ncbi:MAG TPA: hypothetical protein VFV96_12360 [Verrucomicrobiae bacterium]|nr:hypothetical protein [Verrucomicrobiae bacterium]
MKNTLVLVVALSLAATAWSYADGTIQSANSWAGSRVVRYMPADLGADYRVWNKVIARTNSLGSVTYSTNQAYVELATGLNYQDAQGQWQESKAEFQLVPGWAVANTGRHKIGLAYNLNTKGSVAITMPDGHNMWGQVLALSYVDPATGQSVLLGEVKDCVGTLVASNQVLYADAFTDVKADVRYTYTKAGIEQDIVLREQLPDPSLIGMNPATTRLAVVTEFINPPSASVTEDAASSNSTDTNSLPDERINLGVMRFGEGRAFETGQQSVRRQRVGKKWATMNGRTFLFEEVPLSVIKASVNQLPKQASARPSAKVKSLAQMEIPSQRVAHTERRKMQMAKIEDEGTSSGFVLDYVLLNSSTYNYTFRGNTTYFVSGSVYIDGVTVEGGQ